MARMSVLLAAPALVGAALAPASAFAVNYLTVEQAGKLLFAEADRFEQRYWQLDAEQLQKLAASGVKPRSARWTLRLAWRGKELLGVLVADEVIGKFELISYAVGVGADGVLKGVEILAYRESHGSEIRLPAWRKQFVGKTAAAPIKLGDDIANISGATLSCGHVTEGVKRIVQVIELARRSAVLA
ncbi:FMN-binding protein [Paucibacter sp. APW11]|uniref:FMN-binding protein n=1 Tax=Roseateles aquae TaxID=3077235 RepID=A0ABU3P6P1_9BURK|nr:FMN-binding protein [Paucibacter sp. APW11]MDT8997890.1 FMN-binding protein [Paucibacter sp. APW11]